VIGMHFQRKRSERGASLIMLVAIIGLAFIVTVAGFLVAASDSQDTARLASAKVDIATREDALMREILLQTAIGMLPSTSDGSSGPVLTWTQIMTNAVTALNATSYVDPVELAALQSAGAIPANVILANTGDTGGTLLGIFQGYNNEVPYGGTSGLANLVPVNAALAAVEPPLMNWSGNATLATANALTNPQEFFLGSQYTAIAAPVPTALSSSKRWGMILYPNIRFGYKNIGDAFVARRVWWRIPLVYQTTQQTQEDQVGTNLIYRYPSAPANYVLSAYEIPSQLPISGDANLQIGNNTDGTAWGSGVTISGLTGGTQGSIYGRQIQLAGGTYGGISSRQAVNVLNPATVAGTPYSNSAFDAVGTRETLSLTQALSGAAAISVAGNDGKVLVVPVAPGNQFYMTAPGGPGTETHWDLYARPYYRCRIRIIISGTNSTLIYNPNTSPQMSAVANAGAISVNVIVLPDSTSKPDQILGFLDGAAPPPTTYSQASYSDPAGTLPPWMTYTSTGYAISGPIPGRNILIINVGLMVTTLATALGSTPTLLSPQLYSLYVGSNPTSEPLTPATTSDPGVAITGASDLHLFTSGLSIISNQTLYLLDAFNQSAPQYATSIFAPDVRYGISGVTPASTTVVGQISVDQASPLTQVSTSPTPGSPLQFLDADGNKISTSTNTFTLSEVSNPSPTQMPPITRLTLLFTIERDRTN
jgi:hypothetical protein